MHYNEVSSKKKMKSLKEQVNQLRADCSNLEKEKSLYKRASEEYSVPMAINEDSVIEAYGNKFQLAFKGKESKALRNLIEFLPYSDIKTLAATSKTMR